MLHVVYKAPNELLARSVLALLTQSGVPAFLRSYQISAHANLGSMLYPNWGEILVEEIDLERAGELIAGFFESRNAEASPGEAPDQDGSEESGSAAPDSASPV